VLINGGSREAREAEEAIEVATRRHGYLPSECHASPLAHAAAIGSTAACDADRREANRPRGTTIRSRPNDRDAAAFRSIPIEQDLMFLQYPWDT
jgi:hypothetical protein